VDNCGDRNEPKYKGSRAISNVSNRRHEDAETRKFERANILKISVDPITLRSNISMPESVCGEFCRIEEDLSCARPRANKEVFSRNVLMAKGGALGLARLCETNRTSKCRESSTNGVALTYVKLCEVGGLPKCTRFRASKINLEHRKLCKSGGTPKCILSVTKGENRDIAQAMPETGEKTLMRMSNLENRKDLEYRKLRAAVDNFTHAKLRDAAEEPRCTCSNVTGRILGREVPSEKNFIFGQVELCENSSTPR